VGRLAPNLSAPEHDVNIPLFFNREYMQQMAQQLALIKLMRRTEEVANVY